MKITLAMPIYYADQMINEGFTQLLPVNLHIRVIMSWVSILKVEYWLEYWLEIWLEIP